MGSSHLYLYDSEDDTILTFDVNVKNLLTGFTRVGASVYFFAKDPVYGVQLYRYAIESGTVSVVNQAQHSSITLHPNPTTDLLSITAENAVLHVYVYTTDGRLVLEVGGTDQISVADLPSGVYVAKVTFEDAMEEVATFIKQ